MIHSKTIVIDDEWSTIGSLNLDNISLRYNFEGNIVSLNKEFSMDIKNQFCNDLESATELTLSDWKKRSFFERCIEILVLPIRQFL
jgi:cardiolipin synthase